MRMMRWGVAVIVAIAGLGGLFALEANAVPRYTARYEQKCGLCHVNPSGGGLRTSYASQKLVPEEIAWSPTRPAAAAPDPQLTKNILVGTDYRLMYIGSDVVANRLNFFPMQSDLYLDFQLEPRVSLYYDRGPSNSYEMFGLAYLLPVVYAKAGRFAPSYGWKFDDHTMFVRSELGFMPPTNTDAGFELGASPGRMDVQVAAVNGNRGSTSDNDSRLAFVGNVAVRFHAAGIAGSAGVSGYHHPSVLGGMVSEGGYGYLVWKNLTWLGEADWVRVDPAGTPSTREFVTSHEFSYLLHQGLEVIGTYDFFDPNRDLASGARRRWGAGVFLMPRPFAGIEYELRRTTYENGVTFSGKDAYESVMQLHLLY